MPRASPIQYAFNVGEISPLLYGRVDQEWFGSALAECQRYIPLVQGPITRCPGTYFVAEVKDSSAKTLVRRFEFSTTQAYILEFGNQYLRFYKDNAQITLAAQNVSGVTNANPAVLTYVGADTYANGDRAVVNAIGGMTQLNNREFTVANVNVGAKTFELSGVNSTAYGAYTSGGTVAEIYEISTPYVTADLPSLYVRVQSADTLYIFHPSYAPRKLTRTAHTNWTLTAIDFLDGPYLPTNVSATTFALSATTGSVTVTSTVAIFAATDVGRSIRWKDPAGNWTWLKITAFTDTTHVTATIRGADASAGTATVNWRLGVWSATTGYPGCGSFFEDRLFAAGATNYPTRLDGSRTGDYENFAPSDANGTTITDSHAVSFSLNANTVNNIKWMLDDEHGLLAGTVGGEWLIRPSALGTALTPTNISAKQSTAHGSANIPAIRTGKTPIFVQRAGRKLRELSYDYRSDGLISADKTTRSEHITKGGIVETAYQQEPHSLVWSVRADGVLLGFTYEYEQEVNAWHRHPLGGTFSTGGAVVESIAVIPSADGTRDELWLEVKRTINGATKRTIEYMPAIFSDGDDIATDAFFVDCGLTYSGAPTTIVTGLNHLEGQTVSILADGAVKPDAVVTAGAITIPVAASTIHVGLRYTSRARALRLTAGAADGTSQGKLQRVFRVVIRLLASVGLDVGPMRENGTDNLSPLNFYESGMALDTAIPPFSGDKRVPWEGNYDRTNWMVFQQSQPLPSTITALMPQLEVEDES